MTVRSAASAVQAILGDHYNGSTDVTPFIVAASSLVDRLDALDTDGVLPTTQLELIERWLAAHFYLQSDPITQETKTGRSGGIFEGKTDMALDNTRYGQMAKVLDWTGRLGKLGGPTAGMSWLGKPVSDQIAYEDRD